MDVEGGEGTAAAAGAADTFAAAREGGGGGASLATVKVMPAMEVEGVGSGVLAGAAVLAAAAAVVECPRGGGGMEEVGGAVAAGAAAGTAAAAAQAVVAGEGQDVGGDIGAMQVEGAAAGVAAGAAAGVAAGAAAGVAAGAAAGAAAGPNVGAAAVPSVGAAGNAAAQSSAAAGVAPSDAAHGDSADVFFHLLAGSPAFLSLAQFVFESPEVHQVAIGEGEAEELCNALVAEISARVGRSERSGAGIVTHGAPRSFSTDTLEGACRGMLSILQGAREAGDTTLLSEILEFEKYRVFNALPAPGASRRTGASGGGSSADAMGEEDAPYFGEPEDADEHDPVAARAERRRERLLATEQSLLDSIRQRWRLMLQQEALLAHNVGCQRMCFDCGILPASVFCLCSSSYVHRCAVCDYFVHFYERGGRMCRRWAAAPVAAPSSTPPMSAHAEAAAVPASDSLPIPLRCNQFVLISLPPSDPLPATCRDFVLRDNTYAAACRESTEKLPSSPPVSSVFSFPALAEAPLPMPLLHNTSCPDCSGMMYPHELDTSGVISLACPVYGSVKVAWPRTLRCFRCLAVGEPLSTSTLDRLRILSPTINLCTLLDPRTALSSAAVELHLSLNTSLGSHKQAAASTAALLSTSGNVFDTPRGTIHPSTISPALKAAEQIYVGCINGLGGGDIFPCLACGTEPPVLNFDATLKVRVREQFGLDAQYYQAGMCVLPNEIESAVRDWYDKQQKERGAAPRPNCEGHLFAAAPGTSAKAKRKLHVVGVFVIVCRHGTPYYMIQIHDNESFVHHVIGICLAFAHRSNASSDIICLVLDHIQSALAHDAAYMENIFNRLWPSREGQLIRVLKLDSPHAEPPVAPWVLQPPLSVSFGPLPSAPSSAVSSFTPASPPVNTVAFTSLAVPAMHALNHKPECRVAHGALATPALGVCAEYSEWLNKNLALFGPNVVSLSPLAFRQALELFSTLQRLANNLDLPSKLLHSLVGALDRLSTAATALDAATHEAGGGWTRLPSEDFSAWLQRLDALVLDDAQATVAAKEKNSAMAAAAAEKARVLRLSVWISALELALLSIKYRDGKPLSPLLCSKYLSTYATSPTLQAIRPSCSKLELALSSLALLKAERAVLAQQESEEGEEEEGEEGKAQVLALLRLHAASLHALVDRKAVLYAAIGALKSRESKTSKVLRAKKAEVAAVYAEIAPLLSALKGLCAVLHDEVELSAWASKLPTEARGLSGSHFSHTPVQLGLVAERTLASAAAHAVRRYHVASSELQLCRNEIQAAALHSQQLVATLDQRVQSLCGVITADALEFASGEHGMFLSSEFRIRGHQVLLHVADARSMSQDDLRGLARAIRGPVYMLSARWRWLSQRLHKLQVGVDCIFAAQGMHIPFFACARDSNLRGGRAYVEMRLGQLLSGALAPEEWAQLAVPKEKRAPVPPPPTARSAAAASTVTASEPEVWDEDGQGWEEGDTEGEEEEEEQEGEEEEGEK